MNEEFLNVASQCRATATSDLAGRIEVDDGRGTLRELLNDAAYVIEKALAQPEQPAQEPVGVEWTPCIKRPHVVVHVRQQHLGETHVSTREGITPAKPDDLIMRGVEGEEYPIGRVLFLKTYTFDTSTPKRPWVGLMGNEINALSPFYVEPSTHDMIRAAEAILKGKNT